MSLFHKAFAGVIALSSALAIPAYSQERAGFTSFSQTPSARNPDAITSHYIMGQNVMGLISPDGKTLAGMGVDSGKWVSVPLKNQFGKAIIIASNKLVVCKDDESIHVLDSTGKEWKSIKLQGNTVESQPIVGNELAVIRVENRIYAYGLGATSWSELSLPEDQIVEPHISSNYVQAYSPNYIYTYTRASNAWTGIQLTGTSGGIQIDNSASEQP
ncbi:MAG: hypothetical protein R3C11_29610 [Planctomycetaceae bacterium]